MNFKSSCRTIILQSNAKKKDIFKSITFTNRQIPENNGGRYQQIEAIA